MYIKIFLYAYKFYLYDEFIIMLYGESEFHDVKCYIMRLSFTIWNTTSWNEKYK